MSTLIHAESRRSYSWWWGSHIGPKNSKWLQENLTDMDTKVKAMIRLIEEDADSFARRAEMYYKKRPELLKFVEEFYRAYRALAERYDHATGALRYAHQTIAEVLPNQIPLVPDESPSISNDIEVGPYTPEMPSSVPSLFDPDYLQTDVISGSPNFHARERNGGCSEGTGSMAAKKGLKQLNEMFARDGTARVKLHEGKLRKGFKFHEQEEEEKASVSKVHVGSQILFEIQSKKKENDVNEMKHLQDELSKLQFEKESASLQNQILLESISSLKIEISEVNAEFGRLYEEIMKGIIKISSAEEHCIMLAKEKVCLKQELEEMKKGLEEMQILSIEYQTLLGQEVKEKESVRNDMKRLEEAFSQLSIENQNLRDKILSESKHLDLSRSEVQQLRDATSKLQAEKTTVLLQNQLYLETIYSLETEIYRAEHEIKMFHEEIITGIVKLDTTEERRLHLEKEKEKLEFELEERKRRLKEMQVLSIENCNLLEQEVKKKENANNEIKHLQEEFSKVLIKNEDLNSQLLLELKQLDLCRSEVQNSGYEMCKLLAEKEAYSFQNQLFRENISCMELESFRAKGAIGKLHEEIVMAILKFSCAEEECLTSSEKTNQSLKLELEEWKRMLEELRILSTLNQNLLEQEVKVKENARDEINCLQEELYQLNRQTVSAFQNVDTFKTEVQNLRNAMSQLGIEKETTLFQYLLSQESICLLETEISMAKDEIRKLYEEILMGVVILCSTEEQNLALYEINQSLSSELKEIKICLEELWISFIEKDNQHLDAERSLQSRDRLYNLSHEKVKLMTLEMQTIFEKLNDIKVIKVGLEEEVCQLKSVNNSLTGHNLSYALQIKHMQDDIIFLKEKNCKLEDELKVHLEDRKVFQQVLDFVKDDRDELDMKHKNLIEQMRESNLKIGYLETLVKELNCGLAELKQGCMKVEDEKLQLLLKLRDMEAISESNAVLRNSLSDANMELEALREKIRVLEDSYENLNIEVSNNAVEKAVLATNVEVLADNVVKLSEKNTLLESSLADANTKLEGLQTRLGDLDNYNHSLSVENLNLLIQKEALISQVESIRNGQANFKTRNALLENKLVTLEKEKEHSFTQIIELKNDLKIKQREHESLINSSKIRLVNLENQIHLLREDKKFRDDDLEFVQQKCLSYMIEAYVLLTCLNDLKGYLIIEKQNHDHHIQSSKNHLATLENKIDLLQEERQLREYEVDEEQKKLMNCMLENFILWRCLSETKEKNFILLEECYKHLEVSRCAEEVISQLEDSKLLHMEKITLLMEHNAKLKDGMKLLLESLNINSELMGMIGTEVVMQAILCEIAHLLSTVSDFQDENQLLHMELSVYRTLLKQSALEKFFIGQVLGRAGDQLLVQQWDQNWLLETCKQLDQEVNDRDYLNEALKFELLVLSRHLMDLSKELYASRKEKNAMEEENNVLLRGAMTLEHLQLYFRGSTTENMHAVKVLGEGFCSLLKIKKDLNDLKIETDMRLKIVDTENKMLKDSFFLLEELRSQVIVLEFDLFTTRVLCEELILEVETGETLLERKNMDILRSRHKLQCMEEEVTRLCAKLETTNKDLYEAQMVRSQLEEKVTDLLEAQACNAMEIATSYDEKRVLNDKLIRLNDEVELLRGREEHVTCKLQEKIDEIERCEGEFVKFINEVQAFAINIAVLEDQLLQLVVAYVGVQICALAQREMLKEGVTLRNTFAFEFTKILDDLKVENGKLEAIWNACFPLFMSLDDGIAAIEKQAQQLAKLDEEQENSSVNHQDETNETSISGHPSMLGALQLQNLVSRVEAIQELMIDTNSRLKQERLQYAAELDAARREIEGLKLENSCREAKQGNEASRGKQGQVMKDIELDQVSSSNVVSRIQSAESEDQMLKLWETAERECSNLASNGHEVLPSEEAGGGHLQHIDEKELGVDKQEVSNEIKESQVEWKTEVFERLNAVSKKLSDIQTSAEKLKSKISKCRRHISSELDDMLPKLKETEEEISQLFNVEGMLRRKVEEEYCEQSNNNEEVGVPQRRQASEQARTIMEQIEKLEVELQKTHHAFLKIEQECVNTTTQKVDRLPRILLRDLMHEKRSGRVRKRGLFCGCIKLPKTKE